MPTDRFIVIDDQTGQRADDTAIAMHEDWAHDLIYCDMDGWYLSEDGDLVLADECGRYAYPPDPERFKLKWLGPR